MKHISLQTNRAIVKRRIGRLLINPITPNVIFAATSQGLYRTNNSGTNTGAVKAGTINDNPDEVVFRIQLGAYSKPLSKNVFIGVNELVAVQTQDGITRYLTGHYNNFNDAAKQRIDMIAKGFPGAFVVVYKGGKRISLSDAGVKSVANTPENTPAPEEESTNNV